MAWFFEFDVHAKFFGLRTSSLSSLPAHCVSDPTLGRLRFGRQGDAGSRNRFRALWRSRRHVESEGVAFCGDLGAMLTVFGGDVDMAIIERIGEDLRSCQFHFQPHMSVMTV